MPALAEPSKDGATAPMTESLIREAWPSLMISPVTASLARRMQKSIILAPLGWLMLIPSFTKRLIGWMPGFSSMSVRYRLTNQRLATFSGFPPKLTKDVALNRIKDVKIVPHENSEFYVAGDLVILGANGETIFNLPATPEPESFRNSILQAA